MEPGTISEDGLWKWDGNNWVEHNREIESPLQDSTTPEINDIITFFKLIFFKLLFLRRPVSLS